MYSQTDKPTIMKALLITILFSALCFSTYANNLKNEKGTGDKAKKEVMAKKLKGVKVYDKMPILDKELCSLDLKFDVLVENNTIQLVDKTQGTYSEVEIIYGDGAVANDFDNRYTYNKEGVYYIAVSVFNSDTGCMDFAGGNIYVGAKDKTQEEVVTIDFNKITGSSVANLDK